MSFGKNLWDFKDEVLTDYREIRRLASLDLFTAIVFETPVKRGVLRNNWFIAINAPNLAQTDEADPTGSNTISREEGNLVSNKLNIDIFLTNNLPYAERIEYEGYSGKAPEGMVRVNLARWDQMIASAKRKVGK